MDIYKRRILLIENIQKVITPTCKYEILLFPNKKQKTKKQQQKQKQKQKTKQNKTKQNKTKQNKTKQNKTKQKISVPSYFEEDLFSVLGDKRPHYRWLLLGPCRSGSSFHIDPNATR